MSEQKLTPEQKRGIVDLIIYGLVKVVSVFKRKKKQPKCNGDGK